MEVEAVPEPAGTAQRFLYCLPNCRSMKRWLRWWESERILPCLPPTPHRAGSTRGPEWYCAGDALSRPNTTTPLGLCQQVSVTVLSEYIFALCCTHCILHVSLNTRHFTCLQSYLFIRAFVGRARLE